MARGTLAAALNLLVLAPAFAWSPARASVHGWSFLALVSAFAWIEAASATRDDVSTGRASRGPAATGAALLLVFVTALFGAGASGSGPTLGLGAAAMIAGIALRRAAMRALGAAFVSELRPITQRDRVVHGPYAWLGHPSEVGLLLIGTGAVLVLASPVAALVFVAMLVPIVLTRMRHESRALRESTGG